MNILFTMDLRATPMPKRLNPDNLTDAIITIGYKANWTRRDGISVLGDNGMKECEAIHNC